MSIQQVLSRLEKVRHGTAGCYSACCPAHDDKSPSMHVRELEDGRILINCKAGCSPNEILSAIGLTFSDLFPEKLGEFKREKRPFPAIDVLRLISKEAILISASIQTQRNRALTNQEQERVIRASEIIQRSLQSAGVSLKGYWK